MIILKPKEIEAVSKIPANKRYLYFIKRVVDQEELWGIYDSDWVTIKDNDARNILVPVWPNKEYADLYLQKNFPSVYAKSIDLYKFIDDSLTELNEKNIAVSVFPILESEGHIICHEKIIDDLNEELEKY